MIIRSAKNTDLKKIIPLWRELINYHENLKDWDMHLNSDAQKKWENFFRRKIRSKTSIVLIAQDNSSVVGYCIAYVDTHPPIFKENKFLYVSDAFISSKFRNHGIAKSMISHLSRFAKSNGISEIGLQVFVNNKKSRVIWESLGFATASFFMFKKAF